MDCSATSPLILFPVETFLVVLKNAFKWKMKDTINIQRNGREAPEKCFGKDQPLRLLVGHALLSRDNRKNLCLWGWGVYCIFGIGNKILLYFHENVFIFLCCTINSDRLAFSFIWREKHVFCGHFTKFK